MRVLDASGILRSGLDFSDSKYLITNGVREEVEQENARTAVDAAVERGFIQVREPEEDSVAVVKDAAKKSGDLEKLSENDISVIALALETDSIIVSDDYNIQNISRILNIKYEKTFHSGIKKKLNWIRVCEGCDREGKGDVCDVCGSRMKRVPSRTSP
ncbi:MAG: hypothetical protein L6243_00965 [Candidatus Altiarchaeales archaeon]|nr:ribonuclease VapC [Candidatus Altiarchaeota archaeon]MCG2782141.1 hypothetical protein [Candidatus Altiarchaeales archaeon]